MSKALLDAVGSVTTSHEALAVFLNDPAAAVERFGLSEEERAALLLRDRSALIGFGISSAAADRTFAAAMVDCDD
ncbi:hypothetical protein [Paraburkholderia tropica]|uniref:hypothetical protein n=1 Tax=Paraburkholderia tropica TaxID=92647 RepID=UPI001F3CA3BA|nr:hypothetical protein [Paraburkholderia tropica]